MIGRRRLAAFLGVACSAAGARRRFPTKPITLAPFAAGGSTDALPLPPSRRARRSASRSSTPRRRRRLIGAASVAKAEPDGCTLRGVAAQVTIPPWINRSLTFDPP
jgi:hypothetical protein